MSTQDYREREQRTCPKNVIRDNGKMINKKIKSQEEWSRLSGLQRDSVFFERVMLNPCLRRSMDLLKKKEEGEISRLLGISQFIFLYSLETVL